MCLTAESLQGEEVMATTCSPSSYGGASTAQKVDGASWAIHVVETTKMQGTVVEVDARLSLFAFYTDSYLLAVYPLVVLLNSGSRHSQLTLHPPFLKREE